MLGTQAEAVARKKAQACLRCALPEFIIRQKNVLPCWATAPYHWSTMSPVLIGGSSVQGVIVGTTDGVNAWVHTRMTQLAARLATLVLPEHPESFGNSPVWD